MAIRSAAHLFVDDLEQPAVGAGDRHHVERVLRLRAGEAVSVSDGRGGLRSCTFAGGAILEVSGPIERAAAPAPLVTIAFALVKGGRPEWIVQKLVECGVGRIVPFLADRSVVRWDEAKALRNLDRLRTVAVSAAMQSRQRWLAAVEPLTDFHSFAGLPDGVARADFGGDPPGLGTPTLLIGPEGGWSTVEKGAIGPTVGLGPSILRAETAAVAAGILLTALRAGLVSPGKPLAPRL